MSTRFILTIIILILCHPAKSQFLMDMMDTSKISDQGLLNIYKNYSHLRLSAYIQPQFQVTEEKGAESFEGGNFPENVSNRFMFRRSRVRIDYVHYNKENAPGVQIAFQFDANERSFTLRDIWGRIFENKYKLFSFTTGMFARPFGYEVNLSSSDRESPERGRMSQTLMKSERDLGAMMSFDVRKTKHPLKNLKIDAGLFNGQGINAPGDFDNRKDLIARISHKPYTITKNVIISGGTSLLYGGLLNNTRYSYKTGIQDGTNKVLIDSAVSNEGSISPRRYYGADAQIKINHRKVTTELRAEFISGKQTGTLENSETPVALLTGFNGYHVRNFNGAYFYLLQHIFNRKHQLLVKYDWYDPNTKVSGLQIGQAGSGFTQADIRYHTLGFGYLNYLTENIKVLLYYAKVKNENTSIPEYEADKKDDVLTVRVQFRF